MRQLTFKGFLKRYLLSLSANSSTAISTLVSEASTTNARLREPLFLYAMVADKTHVLMAASKDTPMYAEYKSMAEKYTEQDILTMLSENKNELPENYHKVWRSYQSVSGSHLRDVRVKGLIRGKVVSIKSRKNLSTYRICKDLSLNTANVNAWLKHGDNRVGLEVARSVLDYAERY